MTLLFRETLRYASTQKPGTGTPLSFAFTGNRIAADTYDAMGNMTRNSRNGLEFSDKFQSMPTFRTLRLGVNMAFQSCYLSAND